MYLFNELMLHVKLVIFFCRGRGGVEQVHLESYINVGLYAFSGKKWK